VSFAFVTLFRQHLKYIVGAGKDVVLRTQVEPIGEIIVRGQGKGTVEFFCERKSQDMKGKPGMLTGGQAEIFTCGESHQHAAVVVNRD
jgi:hypothetical protein